MGFIAHLADGQQRSTVQEAVDRGRSLWRQTFGVDKESGSKRPDGRKIPIPGGTYSRSSLSSDAATKRLITALRSRAPGGWTDDRLEECRHFTGIAYVGIDRVSRQLGMSEFHVFRKDRNHPDGRIPVTEDNPGPMSEYGANGWDLIKLLEKPNNQDHWGRMCYRWSQQMRLTGTALTFMLPNKLGRPMELYVIPTALAIPQATINPEYPDGFYRIQPMYPYGPFSSYPTPSTSVGAPIPAQWMLRFQYPHPLLRYDGYSPLTAMRLHMDELEGMDRSRWYKMQRTINPEAVLNFAESENQTPLPWEEIERIRAEMENEQSGPENAGRLYVATPGASLEPWGTSPKDMDYQAGGDQLTAFILR